MAVKMYNKGMEEIAKALTDLDGSDLRVLLVQTTYVFNEDHLWVDDGTANDPASHEVSVTGYARQTLTTETVTRDDTNDKVNFTADNPSFTSLAAGQTIGGLVLYRNTGADGTSPLIAFFSLPNIATNGGDLPITLTSAGFIEMLSQG